MPRHRSRFIVCRLGATAAWIVGAGASCDKKTESAPPKPQAYAEQTYAAAPAQSDVTVPTFVDVTTAAGIDFVHHTGAFGQKWMPETMGSGGGFLDYDGDEHLDILLINSRDWPGHETTTPAPTTHLYRNRGDGTFEDVTEATGVGVVRYGMGCAIADYDNDGDEDIYITAVDGNVLLRNDAGRFTDVTREANITGRDPREPDIVPWSTAATWLDYDQNGFLDLYVANYVRWTPETDLFTTLDGKNKSYATPQQYHGQSGRMYRNVDGYRFEDVTEALGLLRDDGKSLGAITADFDDDGWVDIFVSNDTQPNFLFMNRGGTRFEEVGAGAGCGYDEAGRARAGMGVAVGELRTDLHRVIGIGNFSGEPLSLYSQTQPGLFQDIAGPMRVARPTLPCLTFGVVFADLNQDGHLDVVLANGHIEPEINSVSHDVTFAQRPQLFINNGSGGLVDVGTRAGPAFDEPVVGRGLATGDIDGDGDVDLLLTVNGGRPRLLRNDLPADAAHQWVRLQLIATVRSNRSRAAIGAVVEVTAGGKVQRREVRAGSSYLSQSETDLHFGLGSNRQVDEVTIRWPNGRSSRTPSLSAGSVHTIDLPGSIRD